MIIDSAVIDEVSGYLWGGTRLDLSRRGYVGGANKYKSLIVGNVVDSDELDTSLKELSVGDITLRLKYRVLLGLKLSFNNIKDKRIAEKGRYSEIDKDCIVEIECPSNHRFIVVPTARQIDNYIVVSWEPMREGLMAVHSLRHIKELWIDETY